MKKLIPSLCLAVALIGCSNDININSKRLEEYLSMAQTSYNVGDTLKSEDFLRKARTFLKSPQDSLNYRLCLWQMSGRELSNEDSLIISSAYPTIDYSNQ